MAGSVVEARNGNPEKKITLPRASIFPFASFLKTGKEQGLIISAKDLTSVPRVDAFTESYILTQAVRQTDVTGIVPHLLGVAHNPEETLMYMMPAATEALNWLKSKGEEVFNETLNALFHNGPCSIDSLDNLDQMWGMIVGRIKNTALDRHLVERLEPEAEAQITAEEKQLAKMTPRARLFKEINIASLKALKEKYGLKNLVNRRLVPDGAGPLNDVTEELTVPIVPKEQVDDLLKILPDMFNRNIDTPEENLNLEARVLRELGKVGNDLTRTLIMIMTQKKLTQAMDPHYH